MAEITNAYIVARREGIAWLNSAKREYNTGVAILAKSGYKTIVSSKLAKLGEKCLSRHVPGFPGNDVY